MVGTSAMLLILGLPLAAFDRLADLCPAAHEPHLHRARLLLAAGRPADARDAVERAADLSGRVVIPPPVAPAAGRTDPLTGEVVPSLAVWPSPAPAAPRPVVWHPDEVLAARADVDMAGGRWGDALDTLADLTARRPADGAARVRHGRALLAWCRPAEAEAAFDAALALGHPAAAAGKAHSRAARNLPVDGPEPPAALAYRVMHAGGGGVALPHVLAALAAEPRSLELLYLAAHSARDAGRPVLAAAACSVALDLPLPAATRADLLMDRAAAWLAAGCRPAAERDADRAHHLAPHGPEPLDLLGQIAEAREDYHGAAAQYAAALDRDPRHGHARGRLALLKAAAPDPSVRDPEAAVSLAGGLPDGPHRDALLAIGHAAAGRFGRAVLAINAALGAAPGDDDRAAFEQMRAGFLRDRPWQAGGD